MKIFFSKKNNLHTPIILTIGMFDGVHKGHQNIIYILKNIAKYKKLPSCILTFEPHPKFIIKKPNNFNLLTPLNEKIYKLHLLNIHALIIQKFDQEFSQISAEDFIRYILIKELKINTLIIGYDHHFGKNRQGNSFKIKELAKQFNFEIIQLPPIKNKQEIISSSNIRKALLSGNLQLANTLLGNFYIIIGRVIHGEKIGRRIGFPTANITVNNEKLIPKTGVYFVKIWINNNIYFGIMNIGYRPTFNAKKYQIEIHVLNFSNNIYGQKIYIQLINYLREEILFNSSKELIKQIIQDKLYIEKHYLIYYQ